ncbi:ubiquitin-conjugating enzyme E2-binding protein [Podospora appendiculata]|uniref:Ubiquitin-conjugating enzyme E2-binding protein n=1 Tax=Podospora appendiculata TaxID=314037 RepID=A0AAE0XIG9_9PEZI|nr:ubiquitin-conjugating enzyme E2-binding protein [Podospora appendiculata]
MDSPVSIYAELLSNIRQISLAVSLGSPSDGSTRITVTADGKDVEVRHRGEVHILRLPAKIALGSALLPITRPGAAALSWRLPLDQDAFASQHGDVADGRPAPWSATDLEAGSQVACRQCQSVIVARNAIQVWKDLPSDNWAEMMEFWHCHKPDDAEHHSHGHEAHDRRAENGNPEGEADDQNAKANEKSLAARGYGASSAISAQQGVGFVDLTTLLFAESDCQAITFSLSGYADGSRNRQDLVLGSKTRALNVFCSSCQSQLGFFNFRTAAIALSKWQLSCKSISEASPGISECLATTLIATISRSGSSKSLIMSISESAAESSADTVIHIWVLNSSIVYSSTATARCTPAVKLLYRLIQRDEADRMLEVVSCDAQEINLPAKALGDVVRLLDESNGLLPVAERVFKEWKVGLLSR